MKRTSSRLASVTDRQTDSRWRHQSRTQNTSTRNKKAEWLQQRQKKNKTSKASLRPVCPLSQPGVNIRWLKKKHLLPIKKTFLYSICLPCAFKDSVAWFLLTEQWQRNAEASQRTHLVLLPPLPAQLSVGGRHGLNHKGGGHVAAGAREISRWEIKNSRHTFVMSRSNCLRCIFFKHMGNTQVRQLRYFEFPTNSSW